MHLNKILLVLFAGFFLSAQAAHDEEPPQQQDPLKITEWLVPYENTLPRDPWVGGPDIIWFVGQVGHYVASLQPSTGQFKRYDLPEGTGPHTVISNKQGVWYAGNRAQHIGLLDPATGDIEKIMLPGSGARDAHTMDFNADGHIWFTVQHGNQIGFLDTKTRKIKLHDVPTPAARPYGLVVANNQPWVALFGTNKLATVNAKGVVEEVVLPRKEARPRRIAVTPDGAVWYVDYADGYLGRYDHKTKAIKEWRMPSGADSRPYAMTSDDKGMVWFVETGVMPNRFVGFDPNTESFTQPVEIASGGRTVRHMVFDANTRNIWFGTDTHTIGRAKLAR